MEKRVWHKRFGYGKIIEKNGNLLTIFFDKSGEKTVANYQWGSYLFYTKEDYENPDKLKIQKKYWHLAEEPKKRKILILSCRKTKIKEKLYYRIIGIDISTKKIASIVDTNGNQYGLHSYNEKLESLSTNMVIEASFKSSNDDYYKSSIRMVSDYFVLSKKSSLKEIFFNDTFPSIGIRGIDRDFKNIIYECKYEKKAQRYFIANFTGSQLKPYRNRHQLKLHDQFINVFEKYLNAKKHENKIYRGRALIQCDKADNGDIRVSVLELMGKFLSVDEFNELKEKRQKASEKENMYDDDMSFEYDEDSQYDDFEANNFIEDFQLYDEEFLNSNEEDNFEETRTLISERENEIEEYACSLSEIEEEIIETRLEFNAEIMDDYSEYDNDDMDDYYE